MHAPDIEACHSSRVLHDIVERQAVGGDIVVPGFRRLAIFFPILLCPGVYDRATDAICRGLTGVNPEFLRLREEQGGHRELPWWPFVKFRLPNFIHVCLRSAEYHHAR